MEGAAAAAELRTEASEPPRLVTAPEGPSAARRGLRSNRGTELDRLARALPPGAALEFVRGLPRRSSQDELITYLEALVRVIQAGERRR